VKNGKTLVTLFIVFLGLYSRADVLTRYPDLAMYPLPTPNVADVYALGAEILKINECYSTLSPSERKAVLKLSDSFINVSINMYLRRGGPDKTKPYNSVDWTYKDYNGEGSIKVVDNAKSAIAKSKLPPYTIVYRGMNSLPANQTKAKEGDVISDRGFMSTSISPYAANNFSRGTADKKGVFDFIEVSPYAHGLYLNAQEQCGFMLTQYNYETEVLLAPGTRLQIVKILQVEDKIIRHLLVLP